MPAPRRPPATPRPPARGGPTIDEAAGHPPGVALLYTLRSLRQRRRGVGKRGVYSRATPIGVNLRPPQATRQGWPYYRRTCRRACGAAAYSRATPGGWPAARSHGLKLTPMRATPCGWPASRSHGLKLTPMRATPCGWPAWRLACLASTGWRRLAGLHRLACLAAGLPGVG